MIPRHHSLQATKQQAACSARPPVHVRTRTAAAERARHRSVASRDATATSDRSRLADKMTRSRACAPCASRQISRIACNAMERPDHDQREKNEKRSTRTAALLVDMAIFNCIGRSRALLHASWLLRSELLGRASACSSWVGKLVVVARLPVPRHAFMVFR